LFRGEFDGLAELLFGVGDATALGADVGGVRIEDERVLGVYLARLLKFAERFWHDGKLRSLSNY
jgi:hypothetical protein